MFSLEDITHIMDYTVNATDVVIEDARTGEQIRRTFYSPGKRFPLESIAAQLAVYGYKLFTVGDSTIMHGKIDWAEIFGNFIEEEATP